MKINWKLRLQNKATLTALCVTIIAFVYQLLGIVGIVPSVTESEITDLVALGINLLVMMGIVTDPTTKGISDSKRALNYDCPNCDAENEKEA